MHGTLRLCAVMGVLAGILAPGLFARAAPPEIYPLAQVHRGQTGYGYTTFQGTKPERFTFEVVSVVPNYLPKQDLIFVKSDDPKMQLPGFWAGMSGSPLYIDDKVACAFSYGFRFNKIALGGCTPLAYMQRDAATPRRGKVVAGPNGTKVIAPVAASMADWRRLTPTVDAEAALAALGPPHGNWLLSAPLPSPVARPGTASQTASQTDQIMAATVPLAMSGFSAPAFDALTAMFAGSTIVPMQAGGAAGSTAGHANMDGPSQFVMGASIAVELYRGDMAASAVGTVSYIDGNQVLAYGHPLFQGGETYAPVSSVNVHAVIPSAQNAFVVGTAAKELGSLVQDRQSAIAADLTLRSPMIPVDIAITTTSGTQTGTHVDKGAFHVEVIDNKFLTPSLVGAALTNAVSYYLPDRDHVTARVDSTVRIAGQQPIEFTDYMYANDGAASVMGGVRGLRVLVPLLLNPFAPVRVERVDIKVDLRFEANQGEVQEVRVPTGDLIPGQRNLLEVRLTRYDGTDVIDQVPLDVPASLAGSIVQVEVSSGDVARLDSAPPVDLKTLLAAFRKLLPGTVWAATIYPADEGIALDGKLVKDLPASALDKLHPQSRTQRAQSYKPMARTLSPAPRVIDGSALLLVRVRTR